MKSPFASDRIIQRLLKNMKKLKKLAFISFMLALVAVPVAFFYFERGSFSEAELRAEIIGPDEITVGEAVEYRLRYRNNSDIRLEDVVVIFEYPDSAFPVENESGSRKEIDLPDINPGQEETVTFEMKVFGELGDEIVSTAWFNYSPQNLSANYELSRTHTGTITEVPVSFEIEIPGQMDSDEEFPFRLRYFSRMEDELENLGIRVRYPSGFEFSRSTPRGMEDDEWEREVLYPNEGGLIEIFGKLIGDPGDVRGFEAELGIWRDNRFITLRKVSDEVLIPQPNLFVDVIVNDSANYVANPGEDLLYEIYFKNVGEETLEDLFLTVELDKDFIDMNGVEAMGGRFQPDAGAIIWSHSSISELRRIRPDEEEKISFWARVKEDDLPYNPEIVTAYFLSQTGGEVRTKINTEIEPRGSFAVLENDPLESEGPLPIERGRTSTYTVVWEIANKYNDLEDVEISGKLPENASLNNYEAPEDSEVTYSERDGEVVWRLDEVEGGAGFSRSAPKLYFQVRINPTSSLDESYELVSDQVIRGKDSWTREDLEKEFDSLIYGNLLELTGMEIEDSPTRLEFEDDEDDENNE